MPSTKSLVTDNNSPNLYTAEAPKPAKTTANSDKLREVPGSAPFYEAEDSSGKENS